MWIIIISFCAVECAGQKPTAMGGVIDAIDALDGTPILIKIQCQDLGASA